MSAKEHCQTKTLESNRSIKTLGGKLTSQEVVTMQDIWLPEFDKKQEN
jgi:hypothetical protein